jgi:hypothetical protein
MAKERYPHGKVIDWEFKGIPEQFCYPGQHIRVVPSKGFIIEDDTEQDKALKKLWA